MVNGGIGILHEASAARGVELETVNGLRTYRENILKHFRTSIGNATGAVNQRRALLEYQKRFYDNAPSRAASIPSKPTCSMRQATPCGCTILLSC